MGSVLVSSTRNVIRHDRVIYPVLFCIYIDALLKRLGGENCPCCIGNYHYFGLVGYADHLMLLSPSAHGLRRMTKIWEEFRIEYGVQYNPMKTRCIFYLIPDAVRGRYCTIRYS